MASEDSVRWRELLEPKLAARTVVIGLGVWLNAADSLITATIMPSVGRSLGGYAYFGWAVAAYLFGCIVAGASAGQVAQRTSLARASAIAALIYASGCAISAASPSVVLFMLGRLVQGIGAGWIVGFCYVAISVVFPQRLWARMFAVTAGAWGVATLVGPLLGGLFAQAGQWRGAFWAFGAQGLIFALASARLLANAKPNTGPAPALAKKTLALLTLSISLIAGADVCASRALAAALLVMGLLALVITARVNAAPGESLVPPDIGRPGSTAGSGYLMIFLMAVSAASFGVYGAALLQTLFNLSPLSAGYLVSTEALGWTLTAFLVSGQPERRHRALVLCGAGAIAGGICLLAATIASGRIWEIAVAGTVLGAGFGLSWSLATQRLLSALPPDARATGSSAVPTVQMVGGAVGAAASGALANLLGLSSAFTVANAMSAGPWLFAAFAPVALLGLAAAARLMREPSDGNERTGALQLDQGADAPLDGSAHP